MSAPNEEGRMTPPPPPYPSAARTSAFGGQDDKLEQIGQSLAHPGTDFRLLLIRAPGGIGKSRHRGEL